MNGCPPDKTGKAALLMRVASNGVRTWLGIVSFGLTRPYTC